MKRQFSHLGTSQKSLSTPKSLQIPKFAWIISVLVLLVFFFVIGRFSEGREFARILERAMPAWLLASLALQSATYICAVASWKNALEKMKAHVPFKNLLFLVFTKLFLDQVFPSVGMSGTIIVVNGLVRRKIPRRIVAGSMLINLFAFFIANTLLFSVSLGLLWFHRELNRALVYLAFIASATLILLTIIVLFTWCKARRDQLHPLLFRFSPLGSFLKSLGETPPSLVTNWTLLAETVIFHIMILLLDVATLWTVLRALGLTVSATVVFIGFIVSSAASTASFLPGGLGVFEGGLTALLHFLSVPLEASFAAALLLRGFTFWLPMIPGFMFAQHELRIASR